MRKKADLQNIQVRLESFECTITTDIAVFGYVDGKLKVLLIKREIGEFRDHWFVPGGVMESNETIEDCAKKVLFALTGFQNIHFKQVKTYSAIDRHPLKRVITVCFYALVKPENHPLSLKGSIEKIEWFDMEEIPEQLGFDHAELIREAYIFLQNNLKHRLIVGELLPTEFTLQELQSLYEDILNVKLDRRNFRKRISQMEVLENTGVKKKGVKGGPYLYRLNDREKRG